MVVVVGGGGGGEVQRNVTMTFLVVNISICDAPLQH